MENQEIKQNIWDRVIVIDIRDDVHINQVDDYVVVEKSKLPDLIKILQSFVVMLLLSVSVFGQTDKSKADTTQWFTIDKWDGQTNLIYSSPPIVYDTIASWLLTTTKEDLATMTQIKGYAIKPREMAIGLTVGNYKPSQLITYGYLDNNKKPMPDNYIVWMSVKR